MNEYAIWASPLIAIAALVYTVVVNRGTKHEKRFADMAKAIGVVETQLVTAQHGILQRVDKVEDRVTKVEAEIEHMPDKDHAQRLELAISRLEGRFDVLSERIKPIAAISDRIQDAVLEKVTAA